MKVRSLWLLAMLIHGAACGSSGVASLDSAGDQSSAAAETTPVDQSMDEATRTCLEFPGCSRLIYDQTGCPIRCDVDGPDASAAADATDATDVAADAPDVAIEQTPSEVGCERVDCR